MTSPVNSHTAYLFELIMPHLHSVLMRVASKPANFSKLPIQAIKKITRREYEILQWVQMGKTNWEISSILEISPLTVKNHVQNILRKLDVDNRGQAAAKAVKLGLVSLSKLN
jgi:transcriptional regulator EpsA